VRSWRQHQTKCVLGAFAACTLLFVMLMHISALGSTPRFENEHRVHARTTVVNPREAESLSHTRGSSFVSSLALGMHMDCEHFSRTAEYLASPEFGWDGPFYVALFLPDGKGSCMSVLQRQIVRDRFIVRTYELWSAGFLNEPVYPSNQLRGKYASHALPIATECECGRFGVLCDLKFTCALTSCRRCLQHT
jgi:hypothetical protein